MLKRITALVLSLLLIVAALPMAASAATEGEEIVSQISRLYRKTLYASGESSLHGWCGFMTGYQLYFLGVDTIPHTFNGKDEYNIYCNKELSTGGHRIKAYSAEEYTLREALYTITNGGTRDVYNIMVGFHWTSTEAGRQYGHALLIHAILDGTVYYAESFNSTIGGREGTPIVCSIDKFVNYYDDWTQFEGLVVFGQKVYTDFCNSYATDIFVTTTAETPVLTQPAGDGADAVELRKAPAGERFRATELLETPDGLYFYRVTDAGNVCYLPVETTELLRINTENVTVSEETAPSQLASGEDFTLKGRVIAGDSIIGNVHTTVLNAAGETALTYEMESGSRLAMLSGKSLNSAMEFGALAEGTYTYQILADVVNQYIDQGELKTDTQTVVLSSTQFQVGEEAQAEAVSAAAESAAKDGWVWENDTWYCYQNGAPRVGWFCENGINYYLKGDGSVTTGKANVNGKERIFSDTGALRTGWMKSEDGRMYLLSNGAVAPGGWRTIGDGLYYLQDNGTTSTNCWLTLDGAKYYLLEDGRVATGWTDLEDGTYCFRADGRLMAQSIQEDGYAVIRVYNETTGEMQNGY